MSTLLFNTDPPVYSDRIRTRHIVIRANYAVVAFNSGHLCRSVSLVTMLNARGDLQRIADTIAQLQLPNNTQSVWVESV
jgi:hypothetical protein